MYFNGLRLDNALDFTSNFCAWKDRMDFFLDEDGVLEYTQTDIPKPATSDAQALVQ